MFSIKSLIIAGVAVTSMAVPAVMVGGASAENGSCTLEAVRPNVGEQIAENRKFTKKDGRVYIKVVVKGKNCAKVVTMESWKAPNGTDGKPYKEQTLYRSVTKRLDAGSHLISVKLPNCYYQVDLIHGNKTMGASPDADIKFDKDRVIGSVHGGNQACTPDTPDTPDTPEVPETPETPTTPTTDTKTASSTTTSLVKTGPGTMVAGIFGGVSSLTAAAHFVLRRKFLNA